MSPHVDMIEEQKSGGRLRIDSQDQERIAEVLFFSLDGNSSSSSYSFWFVSAVLLVGVMPLRGFAALTDEIEDNTLDLLIVTRLSSRRIAFGKWSALVVQTLLLCVTVCLTSLCATSSAGSI